MKQNRVVCSLMKHKQLVLVPVMLAISATPSFASTGGGLPWEAPLTTVKNSLTGPVALAVSTCALFACGAVLVFGGEMTEFVKRALYAVIAISFIVGGASFITTVFGFSGATIALLHIVQPLAVHLAHASTAGRVS
ncbi:MAG: TrbC/VirB2 family protein [Acidobacteriaceae bacterium]|nr:TrbC/VirB2 family protein [Acidobacteriaceae bacterium]